MGEAVVGQGGDYVAAKDVNVREKPKSRSKKIGTLNRGDKVQVYGLAKDDRGWVAVLQDSEPFGFVFGEMLLPLIDGALDEIIRGNAERADGKTCDYAIRFDGKSSVEDDLFNVSDYSVLLECKDAEPPVKMVTPLFLTEAPYRMGAKPDYQITLDFVSIAKDYDEVLSTTSIYNSRTEKVRLDAVSMAKYRSGQKLEPLPAPDVTSALHGAVQLAVGAWNDKLWADLAKAKP